MMFTDELIRNNALPAIIKKGKELYEAQCVKELCVIDDSFIATITGEENNRVVITPTDDETVTGECTCGFSLGGVCEHGVAVMYMLGEEGAGASSIDGTETSAAAGMVHPVSPKPTPRLYLSEYTNLLTVEIRFAYYIREPYARFIEFKRADPAKYTLIPVLDNFVYKIIRAKARENEIVGELTYHGLRSYQVGCYTPMENPRRWIAEVLPVLVEKGYELFGHKSLVKNRIHESEPKIHLTIRAREEGFVCSMTLDFDGIPASLVSIIRALHAAENMVQLSDGSSGRLPREMIELLTRLFAVAKADTEHDTFSVDELHVPLLDMLHDLADTSDTDDVFQSKCSAMRDFRGIRKKTQPEGFRGTMRPYQIAGYEWLYFLQEYDFGGCLADDMGLGKTVQALALFINEKSRGKKSLPNLVVSPTSVLFNWEREAKKFAPNLLCAVYYGQDRKRKRSSLHYADIVLTTYGTLLRDIESLEQVDFNYAVLDEAQIIKNPYSKVRKAACRLKSKHRLGLTGTPIENNLAELWSLFSFINPGLFGTLSGYKKSIVGKIIQEGENSGLDILRKMVFPFILRRLKTQVAKELPPKTETVVYTEMLPRQRLMYDSVKEAYLGKVLEAVERKGIEQSGPQIFEGMLRLRQVCCHPLLIDAQFSGDSGKFQACDDYIDEVVAEKHRVLVFSQFETVLQLVKRRLSERNIATALLTGKIKNRGDVVDRFQNDPSIPVLLITLKAGGVGLNLTAADYVLHLDPWWNPAAEDQASDRAYRIGQTRQVFIYKFITKDSIEERVLDLQERKKKLVKSVIHREGSFMKKLTKEDVLSLFS